MPWFKRARQHHEEAHRIEHRLRTLSDEHPESRSRELAAILSALLALVALGFRTVIELVKIRRALEARNSNTVARFNLTGQLFNQEGTPPMPAGPFNPAEGQGVLLAISPVNAAGQSVTGPFEWSASDSGAIASLTPAADGLSATVTTNPGAFDVVVTVKQTSSGVTDTAAISRAAADNVVASFNLTGSLVPNPPATP